MHHGTTAPFPIAAAPAGAARVRLPVLLPGLLLLSGARCGARADA
ncbi:MAG TPA: hypothetical protein VLV29_08805 [Steroidobacteraceae bacterium]|nr:hypothetical protein [Steroidobacteraceae bacterium]